MSGKLFTVFGVDTDKAKIRAAAWWLRRKIAGGAAQDAVRDDLEHAGNPIIAAAYDILKRTADNIASDYHSKAVRDIGEILLWTLYKDDAYRQPAIWALAELICELEGDDGEFNTIWNYHADPSDWFINALQRSRARTKEQRERGELPDGLMSESELWFNDDVRERAFDEIADDIDKETADL